MDMYDAAVIADQDEIHGFENIQSTYWVLGTSTGDNSYEDDLGVIPAYPSKYARGKTKPYNNKGRDNGFVFAHIYLKFSMIPLFVL